ncbi:MAG: hypothetical protein KA444_08135 [Bacteroidia bacterium]|nr:hypothetical protein [Bacteroidia bacterium]
MSKKRIIKPLRNLYDLTSNGAGQISILVLIFAVICLSGCKDDKLEPGIEDQYKTYFPLAAGHWVEYDADSVVHLDIDDAYYIDTAIRTYSFQIREEIDSSYIDSEGDVAWRISRYKRYTDADPWTYLNLWTAKMNAYSGQKVEDNIRFIKLSFPLDPRTSWNGNAYNNYPPEEYLYENIHDPLSIGSHSFDSTVMVIQNDFVSGINKIDKREVYAAGVGMISKVQDSINTVHLPNGAVVVLNGSEYSLQIRDFKR